MISWLIGLVLAPMLSGVINRVKAFIAGRRGQPIFQLYWDIARLLRKKMVISRTTTPIFRLAPGAGLACTLVALTVVPLGAPALVSFPGDFIVVLGLLGLLRLLTVLAALDTGSSFEGMGASREVAFAALAEPGIFLALSAAILQSGATSLTSLWERRGLDLWASSALLMALIMVALFVLLLAENSRIPVDDPNTHLELTMIHEVMVLDHSGPGLAMVLYTAALKLWLGAALLVDLIFPIHSGGRPGDLAASVGVVLLTAVAVGVVESSTARLPLSRVTQYLLVSSALSMLALFLEVR